MALSNNIQSFNATEKVSVISSPSEVSFESNMKNTLINFTHLAITQRCSLVSQSGYKVEMYRKFLERLLNHTHYVVTMVIVVQYYKI